MVEDLGDAIYDLPYRTVNRPCLAVVNVMLLSRDPFYTFYPLYDVDLRKLEDDGGPDIIAIDT